MRMKNFQLTVALSLFFLAACSSTDFAHQESARANADFARIADTNEIDTETQATVLEAVKRQLLKNGYYPKSAVLQSEITKIELLPDRPSITYLAVVNTPW